MSLSARTEKLLPGHKAVFRSDAYTVTKLQISRRSEEDAFIQSADIGQLVQRAVVKRRILIFTNSFRIGGSEGQAIQLIRNLDRSRFEVYVACFDREGPLLDQLPSDLRAVEDFPLKSFADPGTIRQAIRFIAFLRKNRIQVVQTFDFYTNIFGIPLAKLARVPIVIGSRRDYSVKRTKGQRIAERVSLRLALKVVTNAEAIKQRLIDERWLPEDRVHVIYNGLDLCRFSLQVPRDASCRSPVSTFGVIANLRQEKGHLTFVCAAQYVAQVHPEARFVLLGDGVMRSHIHDAVRKAGLTEQFEFLGAVKNVPLILQSIDVVVSPSDTEGLPNAVLEAMAAGKPVVATDTGGTRELVSEGVTGYLVPIGNARMMANRMSDLYLSPATQESMGVEARRKVEESFTVEQIARQFGRLYSELIER